MGTSRTARALDATIVLYQKASAGRLPRCRFHPTCSQYAREAIAGHGAVKGSWLAARRLGRCRPFGGHGFDPVPEPIQSRFSPPTAAHPLRRVDPC
jgi:putative membrane protein insertion efficiency factor